MDIVKEGGSSYPPCTEHGGYGSSRLHCFYEIFYEILPKQMMTMPVLSHMSIEESGESAERKYLSISEIVRDLRHVPLVGVDDGRVPQVLAPR